MFWNLSSVYYIFFFFSIHNSKSNCQIIFSQIFFQSFSSDEKFIPSQLYLLINGLILLFFVDIFFLLKLLERIENFCYFFIDGICCCFFVFYPIRRISIWSTMIGIYFLTFIIQYMNIIKDKFTAIHLQLSWEKYSGSLTRNKILSSKNSK